MPSAPATTQPAPPKPSYSPASTLRHSALILILSSLFYLFFLYSPPPIFSPEEMAHIARTAVAQSQSAPHPLNATIQSVVHQLRAAHPTHIFKNPPWIFNNAGGAMGSMLVLHCSLREYVIVFGTALGTEGHTGRFLADDYFTIIHGEQWAYAAGSLEKEVYRVGDQHVLSRGMAKQYKMPDGAWALEYARGSIASMMPFGLADAFSSTMDFLSIFQTVQVSAVGMFRELVFGASA